MPCWIRAPQLWHALHVYFAGPVEGCTFLVMVDVHTKWLEVPQVTHPTSAAVVSVLRLLFAVFRDPRQVMSDNGTAFVSEEIWTFHEWKRVQAIASAPYHPTTIGQAECYVAKLKKALIKDTTGSMQHSLSRFLLQQHTTIHTRTSVNSVNAVFGRKLPSLLHIILPAAAAHWEPSWFTGLTRSELGCWDDFCKEQDIVLGMCYATARWFVATSVIRAGRVSRSLF